jgi:hypothetical protein
MRWWRFNSYEIRDGYVRPRAGARLESYDPADDAEVGVGHGPYQSLVKLYDDLVDGSQMSEDHDDISKEGAEAVVEWCSQHGLLGVLPHRVYSVVLAPRWAKNESRRGWVATQREYDRSEDDAAAFREKLHEYTTSNTENHSPEGDTLSAAERRRLGVREPSIVLYEPRWRVWRHEKLDDTWGFFFPEVRDVFDHEYPCPLTPDFWGLYAEPLEEFLRAASAVWESVSFLTGKPSEMLTLMALNALRPLVQPTGLILEGPREHGFRRVWASPSLVGWYGLRIAEDLAEHAIARRCLVCNAPFLSPAYQARYCSERCRKRSNMRAYRAGLKKKLQKKTRRR